MDINNNIPASRSGKENNGGTQLSAVKRVCLCVLGFVVVAIGCIWTLLSIYSFSFNAIDVNDHERDLMKEYELGTENFMAHALDGIYSVAKVYMIPDSVTVMPKPDQNAFGTVYTMEELAPIIAKAEEYGLLTADELSFPGGDGTIVTEAGINYYLDETIFTISWKRELEHNIYNFTEAFISHPSQFRKYITNNEFASTVRKTVSSMSREMNVVVGMSADYYGYRGVGIVVYNGKVYRANEMYVDTCFVDTNGDLIFSYSNELIRHNEIQEFVDQNDISFSLSFGPILVDNHEVIFRANQDYRLGEPKGRYSRASIGQLGELHYLLCTIDGGTSSHGEFRGGATVARMAQEMQVMGCEKAYALDGGQTATMTVNGEIFNRVGYGNERPVSDIIFFATAKPDGGSGDEQ